MSTYTETQHPRRQTGKFTTKAKPGASIGLAEVPDAGIKPARAATERLSAMRTAGAGDPATETAVAAYGLATLVRDEFPHASVILTGECDEPDCHEQHLLEIQDSTCNVVGELPDMTPGGEDMATELTGSVHPGRH